MKHSRRQADVTTEKQAAGADRVGAATKPSGGTDVLAGTRYRTIGELGRGGMGTVYLAEHRELGRRFAVKVLCEELSSDLVVVERMRREARIASQIRHPGIVDVTDVGQTPEGRAFIVMEHLEGETLATLIRREGRLEQLRAFGIAARACEALAAAHAHDVIHRDVKPANIVVTGVPGRDLVKIVDFGIALSPEHAAGRLTQFGTMPGTPVYMAPEQATTRAATVLSDVYALGVVMYEMLTGAPPFDEPTAVETLARKLRHDPEAPSRRARKAGISPAVDAVVLQALARDTAARFQSMEALADAIDRAAEQVRYPVGPRPWSTTRRLLALGVALGSASLAVGAGIAVVRSPSRAGSPPASRSAAVDAAVVRSGPSRDGGAPGLELLRAPEVGGGGRDAAADGAPSSSVQVWTDAGFDAGFDASVADVELRVEGAGSTSRASRREEARRLAAEGRGHLRARRLGEARAAYLRAARLDPGSTEVQGGLGRVAFEQGRYAEAARHLERALARAPGNTGLRIVLGSTYLRMGRTSGAVEQWERVLEQDPGNEAARRLLESVR